MEHKPVKDTGNRILPNEVTNGFQYLWISVTFVSVPCEQQSVTVLRVETYENAYTKAKNDNNCYSQIQKKEKKKENTIEHCFSLVWLIVIALSA